MAMSMQPRRYLASFRSYTIPHIFTNVLVLGSGVAGLSAALAAAERTSVQVVTKGAPRQGSTDWAQGGIAAALSEDDTTESHVEDTVKAGCGLCDVENVERLAREGPERVRELIDMGMPFDHINGSISFTREGGHSRARILHARGDATGEALEETLVARAKESPDIDLLDNSFAIDLLAEDGRCTGALVWNEVHGLLAVRAPRTILATGSCGRIYRETTNPPVATGDGIAMAYRAGAELRDLEFMQFHPTALYLAGASRALISESLRGEGGLLVNRNGERFMPDYHPDAELAPRDKVSRSIMQEMARTDHTHVYLDATAMSREHLEKRFPTITGLCDEFDLDVSEDLIPVRPAAHYSIGGVETDEFGRTTLRDLYACGEVASTAVHGANRLGSNSLLEGLVFGHRAGVEAAKEAREAGRPTAAGSVESAPAKPGRGPLNLTDVANSLRSLMWREVGVERTEEGLNEAVDTIEFWCHYVMDRELDQPGGWELQNMLTTARLLASSALMRTESRGVHFRTDHPEQSPEWRCHIGVSRRGTTTERVHRS